MKIKNKDLPMFHTQTTKKTKIKINFLRQSEAFEAGKKNK